MKPIIYSGKVVSPGMAQGKAFVISSPRFETIPFSSIRHEEVHAEADKMWVALEISISELQGVMLRVKAQIGERESRVFEAHIMMLKDRHFSTRMVDRIDFEKVNAETAVVRTVTELIQSFRGHGEELRQKFESDLRDLGLRLIHNLSPFFTYDKAQDLEEPVVVVARELTLSTAIRIDRRWVLGFVTEKGSSATHAGILVRSMGVPAITGIPDYFQIHYDDLLLLDGREGKIMINPQKRAQEVFERSLQVYRSATREAEKLNAVEPVTRDGRSIRLLANIWMPGDIEVAQAIGAQGLGLIRTEFMYLFQDKPPTEDQLYEYYVSLLEKIWAGPAHFRLLDVGGETDLPSGLVKEKSTDLGLKFLIHEKEFLITQLKSILRASVVRPTRIVYPFFDSLETLKSANQILKDVRQDLEQRRVPMGKDIQVGALIETPEAISDIDAVLNEVTLVVVGSNDLTLRSKGLERTSKMDLSNFKLMNPALLKMIKTVIIACDHRGCEIFFSGQMAEDPLYVGLLIGLGIRVFNLASSSIPVIKKSISTSEHAKLAGLAQQALAIQEEKELVKYLNESFKISRD